MVVENLSKVKAFYIQGNNFAQCAERSMGEMNEDGSIQLVGGRYGMLCPPVMVNAAFACEMFLKISGKDTFDKKLEAHSNDFVNWRYYIENPGEYIMEPFFTCVLMKNLEIILGDIIEEGEKDENPRDL